MRFDVDGSELTKWCVDIHDLDYQLLDCAERFGSGQDVIPDCFRFFHFNFDGRHATGPFGAADDNCVPGLMRIRACESQIWHRTAESGDGVGTMAAPAGVCI